MYKKFQKKNSKRVHENIGIYRQIKPDFGFVDKKDADEGSKQNDGLFVHVSKSFDALNGDVVAYREFAGRFGKKEARITRVIERGNEVHTGKIYLQGKYWTIRLFSKNLEILLDTENKEGFKEWQNGATACVIVQGIGRGTTAHAIEVLGDENSHGYWKKLLFAENRVSKNFPPDVEKQCNTLFLPEEFDGFQLGNRLDYREACVYTIDGADAKDLDDAIQVEKDGNTYILTVHIADVSEYVTKNSPLDKEARKRGTSIYLADEVISMLPKKLSDGVCSLTPEGPKFCLAVEMRIDSSGDIHGVRIFESVIQSKYRGTYEEVQNERDGKTHSIPEEVVKSLKNAWELKEILDKKRQIEGKIRFEKNEAKLVLENGKLVNIVAYLHYESNVLIEHFMVCANEEVSRFATAHGLAIPYRTHPIPTLAGIERLESIVASLGGKLALQNKECPHPKELQKAVDFVHSKDVRGVFGKSTISTMAKALYSEKNVGHFGLALGYYSHFTSPIRRYPDLVLHQTIKTHIRRGGNTAYVPTKSPDPWTKKGLPKNNPIVTNNDLEGICKLSTTNERKAEKLEYDYRDLLVCEWLQKDIGKTFDGIITSVTEKGYFIEFMPFVEGFYPTPFINKTIGDNMQVQLLSADMQTRKITLG